MFMRVSFTSSLLTFREFPTIFRAIRQDRAKTFRRHQEAARIGPQSLDVGRWRVDGGAVVWCRVLPMKARSPQVRCNLSKPIHQQVRARARRARLSVAEFLRRAVVRELVRVEPVLPMI
jgi:hypothetical protein